VADPSQPHWRLVKARWANDKEAQGRTYIFVTALAEQGQPIENALFLVDRGDVVDKVATKGPIDNYLGNYLMTGWLGTYTVSMGEGRLPSDKLVNVGLGDGRSPLRTSFYLTFQRVTPSAPPPETPPTTPEPEPEPVPTPTPPVVSPPTPETDPDETALFTALRTAADQQRLALHRDSTLYRYAQAQQLGDFLSVEFPVWLQDVEYRAQLFEQAIVYFKASEPNVIRHLAWSDDH
jgi:hypothetical protein